MDNYLASLLTEQVNERTKEIDRCDTAGILNMINDEDRIVPEAVGKEIPHIARAASGAAEGSSTSARAPPEDWASWTPPSAPPPSESATT